MNKRLLAERYAKLPEASAQDTIASLKQLYPEYRGFSAKLIQQNLSQSPVAAYQLANSFQRSQASFNGQTTPLALSLQSSVSGSQTAGGLQIFQQHFIFQDAFLLPVLMLPGKKHSKDLRIRLVVGREHFRITAIIKKAGCDLQVQALSPVPHIGEIEVRTEFERIVITVEGFCVSAPQQPVVQAQQEAQGAPKQQWAQEASDATPCALARVAAAGPFGVGGDTAAKWRNRAEKYNRVYGCSI
uniref:Uncharacterized protein n=1 Tax=Spironucleus salmonicida TaxID=348837 RepID=V6LEE6_9EUKA|eukprot:EST42852.1 Hypothetical protein SS50377_17539 [Spironucleus salmonicida]